MPVVSNTSPLLNLAIVGQLQLLPQQFHTVLIPPAVSAEMLPAADAPGAAALRQALADGWLQARVPQNTALVQALMAELDHGEAAAIALALEVSADRILLDERDGRARAKALGLQPVGVLGIMLRAKADGQLASVSAIMHALQSEAGFFIAPALFEAIQQAANE